MALATLAAGLRTLLVDRAAVKDEEKIQDNEGEVDDLIGIEDWDAVDDMGKATEEEREAHEPTALSPRPTDVSDEDWLVYEAFQSVSTQFREKWVKMWA